MTRSIHLAIIAIMLAAPPSFAERSVANPMIHAKGTRIVDGHGEQIQLRGVILEGWLMWNGTLWGAGLISETKLSERIEGLVGEEEAARFRKAVYDTFITESDIKVIADLGFNVVRVPFNHTVLEKDGQIDGSAPGWSYLDRLLGWCEKYHVYVVLGLHAVPGGQSGLFVADPDSKHVWTSEKDLQRTVDLWKAIATRYRDRTVVAGYDLVNEPDPPKGQDLVNLYRRIVKAIRAVDPHHLVFLEGGGPASSDFSFYDGPIDANQAYSFHTYNLFSNATGKSHLKELAEIAEAHDVPLWNGEFGAHTAEWTRAQIEFFEDPNHHVNGWIFWPWKRVPMEGWARNRFRHLMEIESTESWDRVRKHLASVFGLKKIPKEVARQGLADFLEASKADNLIADPEILSSLQSGQGYGTETKSHTLTASPGGIPLQRVSMTRLTADGGRVDWSPDGTKIAFDRKGADNLYDVWEMHLDGDREMVCRTCEASRFGLPQGRQIGQPAYHPSGDWLVMQVERDHRNDNDHTHPGVGVYHDLWVLHLPTDQAYRLTEVSDGRRGRPKGGSLHPTFSHDGRKLLWSEMERGFPGLFGDWRMTLATFDISTLPPKLRDRRYLEPGREGRWFETHGFGPDDQWIYFAGNLMDTSVLHSDIARLDLATGEFKRLTRSAGPKADEPGGYEEHAQFTPRFDAFSYLSSEAGRGREEIWLASPDGETRRQVTRFNEPGSVDHELVNGLQSMPSDNAWNPQPPAGKEQLVLYVQVDFNALANFSSRNEIFLVEFDRHPP